MDRPQEADELLRNLLLSYLNEEKMEILIICSKYSKTLSDIKRDLGLTLRKAFTHVYGTYNNRNGLLNLGLLDNESGHHNSKNSLMYTTHLGEYAYDLVKGRK